MISDIINLNMHIRQSVKKTKRLASHRYNNIFAAASGDYDDVPAQCILSACEQTTLKQEQK